tara:strand:- start:167 stop:337 length:171 start_codon:yes stop_codon:yes gene_type:complete
MLFIKYGMSYLYGMGCGMKDRISFLILVKDMLDQMEPDLRVHHLRRVIQQMLEEEE